MAIATQIIGFFVVLPALLRGGVFFIPYFDFFQGILFLLYAALLESTWGTTIGKQIMNLKVTTVDGRLPTLDRTLIRDASKIYQPLWLIDIIIGMATIGDPHQKISDRFAGTTVVSTIQKSMILPTPPSSSSQPFPSST